MGSIEPPPRDLRELCRLEQREQREQHGQHGQRLKYLYFWGHRARPGAGPGPWCLSQWWPVPFTVEGVAYPSAEHYMMAAKARLFGDEETAARVLAAPHPGAAKDLGRQVSSFDEETWHARRFAIVVRASTAKFGQHPELRDYLLSTSGRVLVEASPLDRIWGIGLTADDERAASPSRWRGQNLLGFALMAAREALADAPGEDVRTG
ncbi:NADAR family protein [Streptomyces profundus]|uniref:NADAR family protein n=1 Tax=Streptomyces profundus TaxID=2867410 RepID=UPI001D1673A8|nr:NADAR family protein [Streptomyces sp. MA3_2.13]UED86197.1 NADAR family protein [Streptomyces sp. MA3_2.13]